MSHVVRVGSAVLVSIAVAIGAIACSPASQDDYPPPERVADTPTAYPGPDDTQGDSEDADSEGSDAGAEDSQGDGE